MAIVKNFLLFSYGFLLISISMGSPAPVKDDFLQYMLKEIKNISNYAQEHVTNVVSGIQKVQEKLSQPEEKVLNDFKELSKNVEYSNCFSKRSAEFKIKIEKGITEVEKCAQNAIHESESIKNEILGLFDNLKIYEFVKRCGYRRQGNDGCNEEEAARVREEAEKAVVKGYERTIFGAQDVVAIIQKAEKCMSNKGYSTNDFLKSVIKVCVDNI